jgi:hypothetical protein
MAITPDETVNEEIARLKASLQHIPDAIVLPKKAHSKDYLPYNFAKQFDQQVKKETHKSPAKPRRP